jgi:hypothetical protein
MQNYLRRFNTENDYCEFKESADFITPNVSILLSEQEVIFNPGWSVDSGLEILR